MGVRLSPRTAAYWATVAPPPRRWLVEGLIPLGCVTLLSGEGGIGKSALMVALGLAVTTGTDWLGRRVTSGPAFAVFAEDDGDEIGRRLRAMAFAEGADLGLALDFEYVAANDLGDAALAVTMDGKVAPTELFSEIGRIVATTRPLLIVLDCAAELFGGDENRRSEVAVFLRLLNGLAASSDAAIVLISHPSLTGVATGSGLSGSTAWNNSVRSRLYLESPDRDDPDRRRVVLVKSNYARAGQVIDMRLIDGRFIALERASSAEQRDVEDKADAVFLGLLRRLTVEKRPVSATPCATYAPTIMAKEPDAKGFDKRVLQEAMSRLFKAKRITNVEEGPPSKRRQRIVETTSNGGANPPADPLPTDEEGGSDETSDASTNPPSNALPTPTNRGSFHPPTPPLGVGTSREVGSAATSNQLPTDRGSEVSRLKPAPDAEDCSSPSADDWTRAFAGHDDEPPGWPDEVAA